MTKGKLRPDTSYLFFETGKVPTLNTEAGTVYLIEFYVHSNDGVQAVWDLWDRSLDAFVQQHEIKRLFVTHRTPNYEDAVQTQPVSSTDAKVADARTFYFAMFSAYGFDKAGNAYQMTSPTNSYRVPLPSPVKAEGTPGLPVPGYTNQSDNNLALVKGNKELEERVLRQLDHLGTLPDVDKRWLAIGVTHIQQAFMAINRSVFKPERIALPEDSTKE